MYRFTKYLILYLLLINTALFALDISLSKPLQPLLDNASIYLDHNRSETIDTVKAKKFQHFGKRRIGFGYSPKFAVWVKIVLFNSSSKSVRRIVEYVSPLTTVVELYDGEDGKRIGTGGIGAREKI
ncbi:Sensory transduction histidine kinase [hydrothermal vent metagenome]|uniref:Sensory transduction histidine kinase n=1 Tax=hydrothermal vent metagenome TaxID=652676 RepID=A0A1W1E8U0_9ZZZZ